MSIVEELNNFKNVLYIFYINYYVYNNNLNYKNLYYFNYLMLKNIIILIKLLYNFS